MQNQLLKKVTPHLLAVISFLIMAALFCKPALEGMQLNQHDNVGWKGMAQNSFEYKEKTGHFPLWNTNLFSGMPNYQVTMEGKSAMPDILKIVSLGLPKPMNFFFLACLFFYLLSLTIGARSLVATLGAIAYAYSTYNPVVIAAGHDTQMLATAIMPLLLAGLLLTYNKKYWLGLATTTYGAYQLIAANHLQITYYFFIIALIITIGFAIDWIKRKEWKHLAIAACITAISGGLGIASNALILLTTSEYSKYTMRGGKDIQIDGDKVSAAQTKGLDTSYAFEYSLGTNETLTFLMPNAFGGSSTSALKEGSAVAKKLMEKGVDENNAEQLAQGLPQYWGALPYTAGPAYFGVLVFILAILGFVLVKSPLKWGLLAASVIGIFIAWGKNFAGFNLFLFEHMPLFNKFRAPSMAQVIPQFMFSISAVLALQYLLFEDEAKNIAANYKKILYTLAGIFALVAIVYIAQNYSSPIDAQIIAGYTDKSGNDEMGKLIVAGLTEERHSQFLSQLFRAILFAGGLAGLLYAVKQNWLKPVFAGIIIIGVTAIELFFIGQPYLPAESYMSADEYTQNNFAPTDIDKQILADKDPNFRVFNYAPNTFSESRTSYFHKSVGGYHPAKLRIYQDLIERYLSNPNEQILGMLNTKYIIATNQNTNQQVLIPNADKAYGNCWLVKNVKFVSDRVAAINDIEHTNLKDTAIVDQSASSTVSQPSWDSLSTIKQTSFSNDTIVYQANCKGAQFAVFSEIYYPKGWNAYIDEKPASYVNCNYVLRGMSIPSGNHTIKFVFEPASVKLGNNLMFFSSIAIIFVLLFGLGMTIYEQVAVKK